MSIVRAGNNIHRIGTILVVAALFLPSFIVVGMAPVPARAAGGTIVFDLSHGQDYNGIHAIEDPRLQANLTAMGYTVVWAKGGLNSTILTNATGLVIGAIYGTSKSFSAAEFSAIAKWFNSGNKFIWICGDSDFAGWNYINGNMSKILDSIGSHVYLEPTSVEDPKSNCASAYRAVANKTSTDPYVASLVTGVTKVLMHGPTCVYGSTVGHVNSSAVSLENTTIANVYPVLYYGASAHIVDADIIRPVAHYQGQVGSFTAMSVEINAGGNKTGIIAVSGANPYADYQPMYDSSYKNVTLTGYNLVKQTIDWAMKLAPTIGAVNWILYLGIGAVAVVVIIAVVYFLRKK